MEEPGERKTAIGRKTAIVKRGQASMSPISLDQQPPSRQAPPMPRQLRSEYPGAMYHVMSRGNRRQDIFLNGVDRHSRHCGIKTLAEAYQKTGWSRFRTGSARNAQRQSGGGHDMAARHLHHWPQSPAQAHQTRAERVATNRNC